MTNQTIDREFKIIPLCPDIPVIIVNYIWIYLDILVLDIKHALLVFNANI